MKSAEVIDRRVFGRRQTDIKAQVRIGNRVVPCTIKDMSEGGALLEFANHIDLPQRLWLSWSEQAEIVCEVRHTRRNTAGVQFSRPQALTLRAAAPPSDALTTPIITSAKLADRPSFSSGAELIAGMRRSIRHPAAEAAGPAPAAAPPPPPVEPDDMTPRDISTLMHSLKSEAAQSLRARAIAAVPKPLPAVRYALLHAAAGREAKAEFEGSAPVANTLGELRSVPGPGLAAGCLSGSRQAAPAPLPACAYALMP